MGIKNTIDWLIGKRAMEQIGMEILREAATFMGQRAVDYAPVDTGFLASHIQVLTLGDGAGIGFSVVSTAFYSQWVEFGHVTPSGDFVPGTFFMTKAFHDTQDAFPSFAAKHHLSPSMSGDMNPEGFLSTTFTT